VDANKNLFRGRFGRGNFFEPEDFEADRRRLTPDLQVAVTLA
jgi:hypothetical protein